jgi:hypothetical protein
MTLRKEWEFEYTGINLAKAAEAQHAFREARIKVWRDKQVEIIAKIKESGLEVHEDLADQMSSFSNTAKYSTQALGGAQVVIDPTMQSDLNKCYAKIREHTELSKQYKAWQQVLEGNPEARVKLDHDDWMFFFGK